MCHLCKDTFSRSDILKRHFQKCSIRRGNPTGANHLAGQRRNTTSSVNRMSVGNADAVNMSGQNAGAYPNSVNGSPTVNGDQSSYASSIASVSARSSRANSLIQGAHPYADGRHMTGLGMTPMTNSGPGAEGGPATSAGYSSNVPAYVMRPHSASNPVHPSHYGYGPPPSNPNVFQGVKNDDHAGNNYTAASGPMQGNRAPGQGSVDWNMFHPGQDGFMPQNQQDQAHIPKTEHNMEGQSFNSADSYNEPFLNGIQAQAQQQGYADDAGA